MELLRTNIPNLSLSLPLEIFEKEILLTIVLGMVLLTFIVYEHWKRLETERLSELRISSPLPLPSVREVFRQKIMALSPDSLEFWDDIAKILRKYIGETMKIRLSPTQTVEQMRKQLPKELGNIFAQIRDIRYAPKWHHAEACKNVQNHIIELLDQHAI
jgi:hypothetical protein